MTSLTESVSLARLEEDSDEEVLDTEDELEAIPEITGEVDEELSNIKAGRKASKRSRHRTLSNDRPISRVELIDSSVFAKRREAKDEENIQSDPPDHSLSVHHVFGYRSYDCRNNCHWLKDQKLVYHVAATAIICDPETGIQSHYLHHTDDILCLAIHPDGELVATGEIGHKPSVHVWSSSTLKILSYLGGGHERGVSSLAFSADGEKLASIGMDDHHSINVWKWFKGQKLASVRNYNKKVFGVCFSPSNNNQLLTYGVKHIRVWTVVGSGMAWRKIKLGSKFRTDSALSCAVLPTEAGDKWVVGMASGYLLIVSQVGIERNLKVHKGAIYSVFASDKETNLIWTGGRDGMICEWNPNFDRCLKNYPVSDHSLDVETAVPLTSSQSNIKSLSWNNKFNKPFLIGTQNSEVLLMSSDGEVSILTQGHCKGEVWGLASHPRLPEVISVSDDRTLRRWSLQEFQPIGLRNIRKAARCVDFHPNGNEIAVGYIDGSVSLLSYPAMERVGGAHHRQEKIADVKFSPDGRLLAVASHDSFVDLYVVDTDGDIVSKDSMGLKRLGVCRDASSYINHVTWHKDSRLLQINSGAGEQLFYEAPKGTRLLIPEKSEKLLAWDMPLTCPLDVTLAGVWQPKNDLTDINAVATAFKLPLVATASDEGGLLKLFKYPTMGTLKRYRRYGAHSSHLTNVSWSNDDAYLISSGGADTSIIVWKVQEASETEDKKENQDEEFKPLQSPDLPEEDVTPNDYEISGLADVSPLPPVMNSKRLTFDKVSKEQRQDSEQFMIALQKLRALPLLRGDSKVYYLGQGEVNSMELEAGAITEMSAIHRDHTAPLSALTISDSDPRMIASAQMMPALVHIWHPQDGAIVTKLKMEGNTNIVTCLSFCPNGRYLAILADASVVHVMNWVKGKHISKAELKTRGVVAIQFASETTVAALTPKALFLCDLVGNALLPTRTLVPPGILPDLNTVLTSLVVGREGRVFVGCSDTSVVEWSARVAIRRSNKFGGKSKKEGPDATSGVRLIIAVGDEFLFTTHRHKDDVIIQVFNEKDLSFVDDHRTDAPTTAWNPSALSAEGSTLVLGAMKDEPFLLFDTKKKSFTVLQTKTASAKDTNMYLDPRTNTVKSGLIDEEDEEGENLDTNRYLDPRTNTVKSGLIDDGLDKEGEACRRGEEGRDGKEVDGKNGERDVDRGNTKEGRSAEEEIVVVKDSSKMVETQEEKEVNDVSGKKAQNGRPRKDSWFRKWLRE